VKENQLATARKLKNVLRKISNKFSRNENVNDEKKKKARLGASGSISEEA
jgi:hypothetical protein